MNKIFKELEKQIIEPRGRKLYFNDPFIHSIFNRLRDMNDEQAITFIVNSLFDIVEVKNETLYQLTESMEKKDSNILLGKF